MATQATYYLDAPSLGSATVIYTDINLTTVAPNGFYSDGVISREQVSGFLLPQVSCPSCVEPCGGAISAIGNQGIFYLETELGATTGAVILRFDPYGVPDGIMATFDGVNYNAVVSPAFGWLQGTVNLPTYIGSVSSNCGIPSGSPYTLTEYQYDGNSFVTLGTTTPVTIVSGQLDFTATGPGNTVMVIPKTTASPSILSLQFIGPCVGTAFNIEVECPAVLDSFDGSNMQANSTLACADAVDQTYYVAYVNGSASALGLYDLVFSDPNGEFKLAAGFYNTTDAGANDWIEVDANGIIVSFGVCALNIYGGDVWFGLAPSTGFNNACNAGAPQAYLYWQSNTISFKNGIQFFTDAACTIPWVNSSSYLYCRSDGSGGGFDEFNLSGNTLGSATGTIC